MQRPDIALIWAQDENGLIGAAGRLPWHLPADLAWFKKQTLGKPILMGRKTFAAIGRPLPGRTNIVWTRQDMRCPGCIVVHTLDEAVAAAGAATELMVIGGAEVFAQALPLARRLYITQIHAVFAGDTYFPPFVQENWREVFRAAHAADADNPYPYTFRILERHRLLSPPDPG